MLILIVAAMMPSICRCSKSKDASVIKPVISLRTLAGWCAANDSLSVDKNDMRYIAYERCTDDIGYNKEVATTEADYQALLQILRTGDFTQLDIHEGGVAYDGYTYIITVQDQAWEHTISLENEDSEAAQQQNAMAVRLLRKLKDIRDRLSEANVNE